MARTSTAFIALTLAASALGVAACGGSSSSGQESEAQVSSDASAARREVGETADALRAALATYKAGDRRGAEDQVAEGYLQHFEEVEGPLEKRDEELTEELEEAINQDLRRQMRSGASEGQVARSVTEILADLRQAESALR
jgi:hypothetical protein